MDSAQAREILRLYRPGTTDALDPRMAEALRQVQNDPELSRWFEDHCGVYIAVRAKLKQIKVPPDLKRRILLDHAGRKKVVFLRRPAVLWAMAAALALLVGGWWWVYGRGPDNSFAAYRDREVRRSQRLYNMTMTSTNLNDIREYLRRKNYPADYVLTPGLEKLAGVGCTTLDWHRRKISMVCLSAGRDQNGRRKDVFLFVANRADLAGPPPPGRPEYVRIHRLMTASWTAGDKVYILAAPGETADLQQYLN